MISQTRSELGTEESQRRRESRQETFAEGQLATSHTTTSEPNLVRDLPSASLIPASDATLVARTRRQDQDSRGEQLDTHVSPIRQAADRHTRRSSNGRYASHGRRPSTIPEEPRESLQLTLEHAAERLAEGVVESALDRTRRHGAGLGGYADVTPGQDDRRRRRRPRRSRGTES